MYLGHCTKDTQTRDVVLAKATIGTHTSMGSQTHVCLLVVVWL